MTAGIAVLISTLACLCIALAAVATWCAIGWYLAHKVVKELTASSSDIYGDD